MSRETRHVLLILAATSLMVFILIRLIRALVGVP